MLDWMWEMFLSADTEVRLVMVAVILLSIFWMACKVVKGFRNIRWHKLPAHRRDETRLFPKSLTNPYYQIAQRRCEGSVAGSYDKFKIIGLLSRCPGSASHADHWYPHVLGGRTSGYNLVVLCPDCNLSKGGKLPSLAQTWAVQWRRKKYFPEGVDRTIRGRRELTPITAYSAQIARIKKNPWV